MPSTQTPQLRAFQLRVVIAVLITATLVAVFAVLWQSAQVFFLVFGGVLLAVVLRSAGNALSRWTGLGSKWTVSIVVLLITVALGAAAWFAAPSVANQAQALRESLGESVQELRVRAAESTVGGQALEHADNAGSSVANNGELWQRVAGGFSTLLGASTGLLVILVTGVFLAFSPSVYTGGMLRLVPKERRERAAVVIEALGTSLQGWLAGQLIAMLFLFAATWAMLVLLCVPLAFLLGLITGIMAFVPYVGPIVAGLPIVLIAFIESPELALQAGVLYFIIQAVESNVVLPLAIQQTVKVPPALLITGQLVLGGIFGMLGLIFATPLTVLGMVLVQQVYVEDTLNDSMDSQVKEIPELQGSVEHA